MAPGVARLKKLHFTNWPNQNCESLATKGGAGALCRMASLCQREHRYCLHIGHLTRDLNIMADDASRLQALSDPAFLSHFEQSC